MSKTLLEDLDNSVDYTIVKDIDINEDDIEEMEEIISDLSVDLGTRIKYVDRFSKLYGYNRTQEFVTKISMMYQFSGTHLLEEYLYNIVCRTTINIQLKIIASKALCNFEDKDKLGFECINMICKKNDFKDIPTPLQIDVICLLMNAKKYKKEATMYFCNIVNEQKLNIEYRYKTILSLEGKKDAYFIKNACMSFVVNTKNLTKYRILSGQYLLGQCKISQTDRNRIEKILVKFTKDKNNSVNIKSDAADVLLQLGSENTQKLAREVITQLGKEGVKVRSIFDNSQNVHSRDIDKSLYAGIEFLTQITTWKIKSVEITYDDIKNHINQYIIENKMTDNEEQINIALNRIYMDRAIYKPYNISLKLILVKVYSYIKNSSKDIQPEILKCLIQELIAMADWCSSGYATRLLNSISGFGDFNYRISWKEQIISNFVGRLNARARSIPDEEFKDNVIEEMGIDSSQYVKRKNFLKFFRDNVLSIREEMYEEFKTHIDDTTFDLAFKSAILSYEN
jgi:hypothetical protein